MQKIDISVSIVCMVNNTDTKLHSGSSYKYHYYSNNDSNDTCLFKPTNASTVLINVYNHII